MPSPLRQNPFWPGMPLNIVAGLFLLRQLLVILAAEQGRKQDLVKRISKNSQEFQLSILVPYLNPNDHPALLALLHAISEQDYPQDKIVIHLVTSEESRRDLIPQSLRPNVKVWQYPGEYPRYENAITWLIERCLAASGNGLFVFLKPTDIVKPDFLMHVAARGIDSFAIQGYMALKNLPDTPLAKVYALSTRLFNRIGNAGRFHMGLSCRLLDSGWAIKQEVLEMIPFHRGVDLDNLEYTIRLNLENFRVNWAPNVVVYSDSTVPFLEHFTLCAGAFFNRISLLWRYGPLLLTRMVLRFDFNYIEQLLSIVTPPYFLTLMALMTVTVLKFKAVTPLPGDTVFWSVVTGLTFLLNVLALVVARCKPHDYTAMLVYTPISYLFGLIASPVALYSYIRSTLSKRPPGGSYYRRVKKTRFNEGMESPPDLYDEEHSKHVIHSILKKNAPRDDHAQDTLAALERKPKRRATLPDLVSLDLQASRQVATGEAMPTPPVKRPLETVRAVPLSNGKKQVSCRLRTLTTFNEEGRESYKLTLEYKTMSFSTESYRILDQAFYELQAKLMGRGLTMITCGSCGNFYNPTVDVPDSIKNSGVCLFDKQGKEVNLNTDAVTVVSQACDYHCPLEQRESIVRQWKESLTLSRTP